MRARRRPRISSRSGPSRPARVTPLPVLAALGLLATPACGTGQDDSAGGGLDVVASFYPMEFLAERIGGGHVSVTTLTEPGVDPHDQELSPRQTAELSEADVVVYLEGLQPAVDDAIAASGVTHVAEAASFTTPLGHDEEREEHEGHPADEGHEHGGGDPHLWLDPVRYAEVAEGVGAVLAEVDPDHAAAYERNTRRLVADLHSLDEEFSKGLAHPSTDTFITTHAAFGYLAERYGLREEAIAGLDPESDPSGARMRELHEVAEEEDVTTVFSETLAGDDTARTLADDLGLRTAVLDPVEGITDDSAGADYFAVMRANLEALREALGAA